VNTTNRLALQHYLDECVFRFNRRHTRHAAFDNPPLKRFSLRGYQFFAKIRGAGK
jgi:hypothetical protein